MPPDPKKALCPRHFMTNHSNINYLVPALFGPMYEVYTPSPHEKSWLRACYVIRNIRFQMLGDEETVYKVAWIYYTNIFAK